MRHNSIRRCVLFGLVASARWAFGTEQYLVHVPAACVPTVVRRHGLSVVRGIDGTGSVWVFASTDRRNSAEVIREVSTDPMVQSIEKDGNASIPEVDGAAVLGQSTAAILDRLSDNHPISYYGSSVWSAYADQAAAQRIHLADVQKISATGAGIVAIIDTGIDPDNPVLQGSLVPGYDFVHDLPGTASEWGDLDPQMAAVLKRSASAIPGRQGAVRLGRSAVAILDQSTAAILDTQKFPAAFGHGTMVAGIVHLVAPTARIMPLKAFSGDGTARISDIVRAIYYAADQGAGVINMSFSTSTPSIGLVKALNYAFRQGIVCVASTGNSGLETLVYPAGINNVAGVASTDNNDRRSRFSNYGPALVHVAAPGEEILTTYPGGGYALVSGTSFAAPFVSGGAALLYQVDDFPGQVEALHAFCSLENQKTEDPGCGRLDL